MTARDQGGSQLREEMPHRPQGKEEREWRRKGETSEGLEGLWRLGERGNI